jgi:hypothetical protein
VWRRAQRAPGSLPVSSGALFRADLPDLVGNELSEPDTGCVGGSRRDADDLALGRGDGELGDDACGGDAPDLVCILFGKPEIAIRSCCDANRCAVGRRNGELGDDTCRGDAPDLVPIILGEPEVAIRSGGDGNRQAAKRGGPTVRWQGELGDDACRGDAPDLVRTILGEPEVAIWTGGDAVRRAPDGKLGDDPSVGLSLAFARIDTMCQITRDTRYNSASPVAKGYEARHGGKTCPLPHAQKLAS